MPKTTDKNKYFVEKTSEIHKGFESLDIRRGQNSLGVVSFFTIFYIVLVLIVLLSFYSLDGMIKIVDGIYKIEERSDKAEVSNKIEVLGDAIVYIGKVESFDRRTQSFEHGTILIRKIEKKDIEEKKDKKGKKVIIYKKDKKAIIYIKAKKAKKEDDIYIALIKKLGSEENKGWY